MMSLYNRFFRAWTPIGDLAALADFIDENAAFLVQKGIYEFSRARAGHYAKVLFRESTFQAAVERSRWQAYPLGLAMIGELVEGIFSQHADYNRLGMQAALADLVVSVFDRYATPSALGAPAWTAARRDLQRRLKLIAMHPRKLAKDIQEPFARSYFDCMPIHEKLRASDFPTITNYLKATLCNIHEELSTRLDTGAVLAQLRSSAAAAPTQQ